MRSGRRLAGLLAIVAALLWPLHDHPQAHSGLRFSSPLDGATLGDSPTQVRLTFLEKPEPSLSTIRVVDTEGRAYQADRPEVVEGDALSLAVRLRPLGRGVYTVHWRVVSAVDGHASTGAYVFGVLVDPSDAGRALEGTESNVSVIEGIGRSTLLLGLIVLLGTTAARLGRFGSDDHARAARLGWALSIAGLALLAMSQVGVAGVSLLELSRTAIGRALLWRAATLLAIGLALGVAGFGARTARPRLAGLGLDGVALATMMAIILHVAAGHAGAGRWPTTSTIAIQAVHFAAAGVWLGGLAALLAGLRHAPSDAQVFSVRRFSTIAALGLAVVTVTGVVRTVQEVSSWADLTTTPYGRVLLAKVALLVVIAALGALNRWRSVPMAAIDLGPLRRTARVELTLAAVAVTAAGFLGTLPPPAATQSIAGVDVSGSDYGTTIRARLTAASDQPGPNRFVVSIDDYDSTVPIVADRVSLRFTPLDDPDVPPTVLALKRGTGDSYTGSGANLSFDGRWRVNVLVERGGSSVDVPLELEARSQSQFLSVLRPAGQWPSYTIEVRGIGHVRISADPERVGPSRLHITCFNGIMEALPIGDIIVTTGTESSVRLQQVTRQDRNTFVADVELQTGNNRITVVARTENGTRLRASTTIEIAR